MPYQQYPIYDLKSGLQLEREPWITPADAFRKLENAFVRRGVLEKRRGLGTFGRIIHTDEELITGLSGTITTFPIIPGSVTVTTIFEDFVDYLKYSVAFTNGGIDEPHVGDEIEGATSGATATIFSITITSGAWATGDAAGTMYLVDVTGTFDVTGEAAAVGAENPFTLASGGLVDTGEWVLVGDAGGTGTINNTTGAWTMSPAMFFFYYTTGTDAAPEAGFTITGVTSTKVATVVDIIEFTGAAAWAGHVAKGIVGVTQPTGTFTAGGEVCTIKNGGGATVGSLALVNGLIESFIQYSYYPGDPVMGIYRHRDSDSNNLVSGDVDRINKFNTTTSLYEDITTKKIHFYDGSVAITGNADWTVGDWIFGETSGASAAVWAVDVAGGTWAAGTAHGVLHIHLQFGTFQAAENLSVGGTVSAKATANSSLYELTGDDADFIWFDTWNGVTYLTNNKDPIQRFKIDTDTVMRIRQLNIDLDVLGGPDNDVNSALMVIIFKSRVLIFSTNESGVSYRQRVRYSSANSDLLWDPDDYVDCPTSDWITGARFISDQLVVTFSKSVWRLVYTGDADLPFRWERISDEFGGVSPYSMVPFDRRIEILGETELSACLDALEVKRMDSQVPDFVLDTTVDVIGYSYSVKVDELQQVWMTYTSSDSTDSKPDKILVRNYDENTWATLDFSGLGIHCMGFFRWETSPTWDGLPAALGLPLTVTVDQINVPFAFRQAQAGFPVLLLGNRTGYVYQYSVTYADLGVNMPVEIEGGKWNPFVQQGKKARLGFIDFYVDNVAGGAFTVDIYLDDELSPAYSITVSCESSRLTDLMKITTAYVGAVANFFTLKIHNEDSYSMKIHAIVPAFQPAGRLEHDG